MTTDIPLFWTIVGSAAAIVACILTYLQGLKNDLNKRMDSHTDLLNKRMDAMVGHIDFVNKRIDTHIDLLEKRMDSMIQGMKTFESKINSLEERMFWALTGKKLEDAILEEKMKRPKTDP